MSYFEVSSDKSPQNSKEKWIQITKRALGFDLFIGLATTFKIMFGALFKGQMHAVKYPQEKLPISPRYRALHKLLALLESGENRCIGCGLCEKICISNCIKMETRYDKNSRKEVLDYSINLGRCIYCGYCAEVCPELAIVHGEDYEEVSEQRAAFILKDDLLTPLDKLKIQKEYEGYGSVSDDADERIKQTPLGY